MKKIQYVTLHVFFWVIFAIIPQFTFRGYKFIDNEQLRFILNILPVFNLLNFYLIYFGLIPWFLHSKKRFYVISTTIIFIFLYTQFKIEGTHFLFENYGIEERHIRRFYRDNFFFREILKTLEYCIYPILIKITETWIIDQKLKAELINQKQSSELALLKFQLSPHFLFNTLNNIYSLVYQKADKAPEAVMKLSEIMRYMLYDTSTDKVPLEKEITYLKSFNELQQLRMKNENFVKLEIAGNTKNVFITPMLLIPFVENAFKHGDKKVESPGIIINLKIENDTILFTTENYVAQDASQNKDLVGGIGLKNVKRRLELLYPGKYSLELGQTKNKHIVKLTLDLHED